MQIDAVHSSTVGLFFTEAFFFICATLPEDEELVCVETLLTRDLVFAAAAFGRATFDASLTLGLTALTRGADDVFLMCFLRTSSGWPSAIAFSSHMRI